MAPSQVFAVMPAPAATLTVVYSGTVTTCVVFASNAFTRPWVSVNAPFSTVAMRASS